MRGHFPCDICGKPTTNPPVGTFINCDACVLTVTHLSECDTESEWTFCVMEPKSKGVFRRGYNCSVSIHEAYHQTRQPWSPWGADHRAMKWAKGKACDVALSALSAEKHNSAL